MAKGPVYQVNALDVDLVGNEYVVVVGSSNAPTSKWLLGRGHGLKLILKIAEAEGLDIPEYVFERQERPEFKEWTPWVVKGEKPFE